MRVATVRPAGTLGGDGYSTLSRSAPCLLRPPAAPSASPAASPVGRHDRATSRTPTHDGCPASCCARFPLPSCADGRSPPAGDPRRSSGPSLPRGSPRRRPRRRGPCSCRGTPPLPPRVPVPAGGRRSVGRAAVGLEAGRPPFEPCRQGSPALRGRSLKQAICARVVGCPEPVSADCVLVRPCSSTLPPAAARRPAALPRRAGVGRARAHGALP